jgi:hypothetical protein
MHAIELELQQAACTTSGSLRLFRMTTVFQRSMPFTTPGLPKERRSKKQTIEDLIHSWPRRRSLSGAAATQVQATSPEAIQMAEINSSTGAASTTSAAGSSSPAALGSSLAVDVAAHPPAQMPMYRARSLPETIDDGSPLSPVCPIDDRIE